MMSLLLLLSLGNIIVVTPSVTTSAGPLFDPIAIIDTMAPGLVLQRSLIDAVETALAANGFRPLTQAQVIAAIGPLPTFPTTIRRFRGDC